MVMYKRFWLYIYIDLSRIHSCWVAITSETCWGGVVAVVRIGEEVCEMDLVVRSRVVKVQESFSLMDGWMDLRVVSAQSTLNTAFSLLSLSSFTVFLVFCTFIFFLCRASLFPLHISFIFHSLVHKCVFCFCVFHYNALLIHYPLISSLSIFFLCFKLFSFLLLFHPFILV